MADSDERAYEEGRIFYWQLGTSFGVTPSHWLAPPGYMTRAAIQGPREQAPPQRSDRGARRPTLPYEEAQATSQIVTGNPDTVVKKLKRLIDVIDPGYLVFWGREGHMSHETAMRGIDLMSQEVIPAIKEYQPQREE